MLLLLLVGLLPQFYLPSCTIFTLHLLPARLLHRARWINLPVRIPALTFSITTLLAIESFHFSIWPCCPSGEVLPGFFKTCGLWTPQLLCSSSLRLSAVLRNVTWTRVSDSRILNLGILFSKMWSLFIQHKELLFWGFLFPQPTFLTRDRLATHVFSQGYLAMML